MKAITVGTESADVFGSFLKILARRGTYFWSLRRKMVLFIHYLEDTIPMDTARKPRDWFLICSWIVLIIVFAGLVVYMSVHVEDLLDADMSSELVLGKLLSQSGGILSNQWYYSTELRVINTQLVYSFFFHLFEDWQTVRILGNVTLYLILLGCYFLLCKRLKISRYFPLSAAVMLLPLSGPYFYILLYGTYYIPRVSMMFLILGIILPIAGETKHRASVALGLFALLLSLALGLEGARMLLILFIPLSILVSGELIGRVFSRNLRTWQERKLALRQSGYFPYLGASFFACVLAVAGFVLNQKVLLRLYPFEQYGELTLKLTLGSIRGTLYNQQHLIGYSDLSFVCSAAIWISVGLLFAWYLLRKDEKSLPKFRFVWFNLISWACYTAFCSLINFGQVAWHMVPVAVLFIPGVAVAFSELQIRPLLRRALIAGVGVCLLFIGIQGYSSFGDWPLREGIRTNDAYRQIVDTLEESGYRNGYASFWGANNVTELSDGAIEVWCVEEFDGDTPHNPAIYQWLQEKSHDTELPVGKTFVIWNAEDKEIYEKQDFPYLGEVIFETDQFIVFDVVR